MTQHECIATGIANGWCSPPICITHDGFPTTEAEDLNEDEGFDHCLHLIRPYRDEEEKQAVERNCSAAVFRKDPYVGPF